MKHSIIAAIVASSALAGAAFAQEAAPAAPAAPNMEETYASARNQLGVLEYCQQAGFVGDEPISVQNRMLELIPAPGDTSAADAAYEKGKAGTVSAMGTEQSLADVASAQSSSEEALCKQIGELVAQAGSQLPPG
ncbi:pore-forming ESAT-6 family protein [Falsirhodobacter xinxiangensis]|uniref:pore-forming ESAT-6 family protein n=1 Tax=Falsirhodobacter xinxiangensis TaxID=2530049 RepID=UPI0010AA0B70|nr:pore-forming ESAT-6 family protein [Rhodobacter xinxiangensis]